MMYWLTALLTIGVSAAAWADDVLLTDGRTLVGIAYAEPGHWVVRTRLGDLRVPISEVRSAVPRRTSLHEYDERVADLGGCPTASEVFDFALWAQQQGLIRYVNGLLTRTLELDSDHLEARRLLGFVKYEGQWITSSHRDALLSALELKRKGTPTRRAEVLARRGPSLETTPYTLGIPMTLPRPTRSYGGSGGYSIWQGVLPTRNLMNLPLIRRIRQ